MRHRAILLVLSLQPVAARGDPPLVTASSEAEGFPAAGALDGDRFGVGPGALWKGKAGEQAWWWQVRFARPQPVGTILQVLGDHETVLRNAPRDYVWQVSADGERWSDLEETRTRDERRVFRVFRLEKAPAARFLRIRIDRASGDRAAIRAVEVGPDSRAPVAFPDWIVAVDTTDRESLPGHAQDFIRLARSIESSKALQAQEVWLASFDEAFLAAEPRPLCAFLSGNFKDWCQVARGPWRGTAEVLRGKHLPVWASCGGAQGLAILAEAGVDRPWDCPHCRDPARPLLPIYSHLGHTGKRPCGDYSACVFERGPHRVRKERDDPALEGLEREFTVMESHCGQIDWPPAGWVRVATAGAGTTTASQCLRLKDRPIYAAQFHIEMEGTPEVSRKIMANFLALARRAGGWRNDPTPLPEPPPIR